MKVAIMQPYFFPYAGYYRLFEAADLFVVYDCVQFPRRGWVHRNKVVMNGKAQWVTLPVLKCERSTRIKDLKFASSSGEWHSHLVSKNQSFNSAGFETIAGSFEQYGDVTEYLIATLKRTCEVLGFSTEFVRSSDLGIHEEIKAQDRILAICEAVKASQYINLAGGAGLYEPHTFTEKSIKLLILDNYLGSFESLLSRLSREPSKDIKKEILKNIRWKQHYVGM